MIVQPGRFPWIADHELSSHPQVYEPHPAIIQTEVQVFAAASDLPNGASGQNRGKVRGQGPAQPWFAHLDRGDGLASNQPLEATPDGLHFRQLRHVTLVGRRDREERQRGETELPG